MIMTTFGKWFGEQSGRGDAVGQLAHAWQNAQGERPRASGVQTITKWMARQPAAAFPQVPHAEVEQVMFAAAEEYRRKAQHLAMVPKTGEPVADHVALAGDGAAQLARIEQAVHQLASWAAGLDKRLQPLLALVDQLGATEQAADQARQEQADAVASPGSLTEQLAYPDAGVPVTTGQAQAELSAGQQRAQQVAEQNGWLQPGQPADPGPAQAMPARQPADLDPYRRYAGQQQPAFYGGHVVAEPDFAVLADLAEPEPDAGWPPQDGGY